MSFKENIIRDIKNLPGKKTRRKIVCIYVDDYGSIRVKDKKAYETLKTAGIPMDYSPALHPMLKEEGIDYINVQRYRPYPLGDGKFVKHFMYNGKRNEAGQQYVVRNCVFEPYLDDCSRNGMAVSGCLKNVEAASRMHAPAIVSTHRVNFVGSLESTHRDDALQQLKELLTEIVKRWPDVEFMDGDQMCDAVLNRKL